MEEEVKLSAEEQQLKDNFMVCPHCGSQLCYHQTLEDGTETFTCMACGFTSSTLMKEGSDTEKEISKQYPSLYKDLRFVDPLGYVWYPAVITVQGVGMVYIDGSDSEKWEWAATPIRKLSRPERRHGRFKGQQYRAVPEQTKKFGKEGGFVRACAHLHLFGDAGTNN